MIRKLLQIDVFLLTIMMGAILLALLNVDRQLTGFREPQVASTTRLYVEEGINLFYPKLNVMADPGYFVLEFPIYQAIVASLWKTFSLHEIWGRIVSLFFWILGSVYLYFLSVRFSDRRTALVTVFLFWFAPISVMYSAAVGIEAMSVCLSIMFVFYGSQWIISRQRLYFFIALIVCVIGFIQKLPNIAPLFLCLLVLKYMYGEKKIRSVFSPYFILLGLVPLISALIWQHHANQVNSMYPGAEWATTANLRSWYFGTIGQRLNPANYLLVIAKALEDSFGSIFVGVLLVIGLFSAKKYYFFTFYLSGFLLSFLIFTNLHLPHHHYMIPFLAPIVFFGAVGVIRCWDNLYLGIIHVWKFTIKPSWIKTLVICIVAILFMMSSLRNVDSRGFFYNNGDIVLMGNIIKEHVPKESRIMLYWEGEGWNPMLMYVAHRRGITINLETLRTENIRERMHNYNCDYLIIAGASLKHVYQVGKKFTGSQQQDIDHVERDIFSVQLPSETEEKLSSFESVYQNNRLRIYKKL